VRLWSSTRPDFISNPLQRWLGRDGPSVWTQTTGEALGAEDVLSNHYATSVVFQGYLFGFDGRQEEGCELRCVELKTGKIRWSEFRLKAGTVMLAGDQLLVLDGTR
jgi:hypothetical protein